MECDEDIHCQACQSACGRLGLTMHSRSVDTVELEPAEIRLSSEFADYIEQEGVRRDTRLADDYEQEGIPLDARVSAYESDVIYFQFLGRVR